MGSEKKWWNWCQLGIKVSKKVPAFRFHYLWFCLWHLEVSASEGTTDWLTEWMSCFGNNTVGSYDHWVSTAPKFYLYLVLLLSKFMCPYYFILFMFSKRTEKTSLFTYYYIFTVNKSTWKIWFIDVSSTPLSCMQQIVQKVILPHKSTCYES